MMKRLRGKKQTWSTVLWRGKLPGLTNCLNKVTMVVSNNSTISSAILQALLDLKSRLATWMWTRACTTSPLSIISNRRTTCLRMQLNTSLKLYILSEDLSYLTVSNSPCIKMFKVKAGKWPKAITK
jgi:hypothetical protein